MRRFMFGLAGVVAVAAMALTTLAKDPSKLPFFVYGVDGQGNHWIPSGYMGNHAALKVDDKNATQPHAGKVCIKVTYDAKDQWGGVFWQDPANDWECNQPGGYNVTGAKKLSFWARGEKGDEKITFGFGGDATGKYPNTAKGEIVAELGTEWKEFSIDTDGKDMSLIKNGFFFSLGGNGDKTEFYLSEIQYQ